MKTVNLNKLYKSLQLVVYDINCFIYNTKLLITKTEKEDVLNNYYKLTNQSKEKKKKLQAPQPVTLNFNQLNIENPGSILANYVVTEKADGDRYLLYIR